LRSIHCLALALMIACGPVHATTAHAVTIANGIRYTTAGLRIDAHSGTILHAQDGLFYWYGDTYACGFYWTDPSTPYCGAQVYRSPDLVHWDGPWRLFDSSTAYWQQLCAGLGCFRPKVVYNRATRLYVLWLNTPDPDQNGYRVLTSPTARGPFTLVGRPELHDAGIPDSLGNPWARDGDEGLFVDDKGIAWLTWDRVGRLLQEPLNSSYTSGRGSPTEILNYPEILPDAGVESPSEFQYLGRYYIAMSLPRCGYCTGTGTAIEQAPTPGGPWTYQGIVSSNSCDGQPNEVDLIGPSTLLWSSDQWKQGGSAGTPPRLNETLAAQAWEPVTFNGLDVAPILCAASFALGLAHT
jgi:hypothetical protein